MLTVKNQPRKLSERRRFHGTLSGAACARINHNRWYDASVGRWLSQDPKGFAAGDANLYRYCGNGPTTHVDPTGLADLALTLPGGDADTFVPGTSATESSSTSEGGGMVLTYSGGNAYTYGPGTAPNAPGYWDRYLQHSNAYSINVGPYVYPLIGNGPWPKSWVPRTGGRPPLLGSKNPITSVPRAVGDPIARTPYSRFTAAGTACVVVGIGFYNWGVFIGGFFYAAFPGSNGLDPNNAR